jgi:hypothetical protein
MPGTAYILRIVLLKRHRKNPSITNKGFFIINIKGVLQHGSSQRDHLQAIHMSEIAKKRHRGLRGFYLNDISFVQLIGTY